MESYIRTSIRCIILLIALLWTKMTQRFLFRTPTLKAFCFIESFQEGTNAKAWLFRRLKNSFINDFRKKSKEPSKVDYQEVESYYNSDDVDKSITTDFRVNTLKI